MSTPAPAGGPQLMAASTVSVGQTHINVNARPVRGGTEVRVNCNGQRVTLLFDGQDIEVEVHSPSQHKPKPAPA